MGWWATDCSQRVDRTEIHEVSRLADFAEKKIVSPRKAILRAVEKRRQKRLKERDQLFRLWQKWHKERKAALLAGEWGEAAQELADFLEQMSLEDAPALVSLVASGPWREANNDTRFLVLEIISHRIIYVRETNGLDPFDDSLPWSDDEPTAFEIIREHLQS